MLPSLHTDADSPYCDGVLDYTRWYLNAKFLRGPDAWCSLPEWRESKRMRNDVAKAWRRGYVVSRAKHVGDIAPSLLSVLHSKNKRQGRVIGRFGVVPVIRPAMPGASKLSLLDVNGWPVRDYDCYTCPRHYCAMWQVHDADGALTAFMDVAVAGDIAICCSGMGHADHLTNGVMNLLFHALMSDLQSAGVTHLYYGNEKALKESSMGLWMRGAGFVNVEKVVVNGS